MNLNVRKFQHLIALAEEGNFTRAAERLGISQPALSRSIAQIEEDCGIALFNRSKPPLSLTHAGHDLVSAARQILGQIGTVEQNLAMQSRGEAGQVGFGIGPTVAGYLLARLLTESLQRWPSLRLMAVVQSTSALAEGVLQGHLDFGICAARTLSPHPALLVQPLGELRMGYFVRSGHPLAQAARPVPPDALLRFPRATGKMPRQADYPSRAFSNLDATVECDDFEALRRVMLRTDAIWLTSGRLVEEEIETGQVIELALDGDTVPRVNDVVMIRLRDGNPSPAVRQIMDAAAALMQA